MSNVRRLVAYGFLLLAAACSGGGDQSALPLNTLIGPNGGTFTVGSQGDVNLDIPPNALSSEVRLTLIATSVTTVNGFVDVGPGFLFGPEGTTFGIPATLRIPFTPSRVSDAVDPSEVRVALRTADGNVQVLVPLQNEGIAVLLNITELGSYWVIAPDVIQGGTVLPLFNNDSYTMDSGLQISVTRPVTEPNVPPSAIKLAFTQNGQTTGYYLADAQDQIKKLGEFGGTDWQEIYSPEALLLGSRDAVGTIRPAFSTIAGYEPAFAAEVAYEGIVETTTSVLRHETLQTVRGVFRTVVVQIRSRYSNVRNESGDETIELWLADHVGPVAVRMPRQSTIARITQGTVGGRAITGGGI
ncbi:hypothetical protein LBMAG49_30740 [Planctomycetota bacterium]|nr:hypothetical protein [Planctomycetota bacterium]MSR39006.1 hypothetical protein [Planctomycetota bacterium]GDY03745.1 hypothetical protein LBMAG49_30740 [Planctomycetota bacterium]